MLGALAAVVLVVGCTGLSPAEVSRATTLSQSGQHGAAEASVRDLLQRRDGRKLSDDDTLMLRSSLIPILENQGRLGEAVELAQDVHQQWRTRKGERAPNTIAALGNLGRLYAAIGRTQQALAAQEQSTRQSIEVLGAWHDSSIAARTNLAATYVRIGRLADAIRLQEAAVDASRKTRGNQHLQTLAALSNLSRSYLAAGDLDRALASSDEALRGVSGVSGADSAFALVARANYVAVLDARGDTATAVPTQEGLLGASVSAWGERHRFTLQQVAVLARLYARTDRPADALQLSTRFIEGAEAVRIQPGLARDDRRALFESYADDYRFFSALHGRAGNVGEGFRLAELSKARTLLESMSEQSASRSSVLPPADREPLLKMEDALRDHEKRISEAPDANARAPLLLRRDADLRAYEALVADLKARHPKFAQLRDPRIVGAGQLAGLVPAGSVFAGFNVRGDRVSAWLVEAAGHIRYVDLGEVKHLADAVDALRRVSSYPSGFRGLLSQEGKRVWRLPDGSFRLLEANAPPPAGAVAVSREAELVDHLSRRLLAPLATALVGKRHWLVSPDGPLAQLPFELLTFNGRRVLDEVDVHYTQSLSVYAMAREQQSAYRSLVRPKDLLALGNPDYEAPAEPGLVRSARLRSAPVFSEQQLKDARLEWASLPGTEVEVTAVRRLMPNHDVYLRGEASEATLQRINQSGDLKQYRYLLFAVHGHLSTEDPSLSSLVLSQRNLGDGTDGYVTAAEWPMYELRSDLTVLSACDTALGQNVSGEGVMGLPFALFVAGNVNTVLTLWPVFDDVTPLFMEKFFARIMRGTDAARALSETKREMAANPKTRHPSNWAPFVLVGAG